MGTIAEQINYLAETKTAIKEALVAKGVSVADTDTFRSYADKIASIEVGGGTGGGGTMEYWRLPEGWQNIEGAEVFQEIVFAIGMLCRYETKGCIIGGGGMMSLYRNYLSAFAFDPAAKITMDGEVITIQDFFTAEILEEFGCIRIEEADFYAPV